MTISDIVRSKEFSEVSETSVDNKQRVTLKRIKSQAKRYKIYANELGQIILDPLVTIPASDLWLFQNKTALASVRRGLQQSAQGKTVKRKSMAKYSETEIE